DLAHFSQAGHCLTAGEQLQDFVEQTLGGNVFDQAGQLGNGFARCRVEGAVQLGGEPQGAKHAHRVFTVALLGVADHSNDAFLQIGDAVVVVDDFFGERVVIKRIQCEVAAGGVFQL